MYYKCITPMKNKANNKLKVRSIRLIDEVWNDLKWYRKNKGISWNVLMKEYLKKVLK